MLLVLSEGVGEEYDIYLSRLHQTSKTKLPVDIAESVTLRAVPLNTFHNPQIL